MKPHLFDSPGHSNFGRIFSTVMWLIAFTCSSLQAAQSRNTLLIKADGTSTFTMDATDARASVEAQARAFERYRKQAQDAEDSLDEPQPRKQKEPAAETKAMTDQELADAIKKNADFQAEQIGIMAPVKLDLVDVQKETVHIVSTMQFPTLKEMVGQSPMLWSHSGLYFNSMQLEKDKDSNLRLTLNTASRGPYLKNVRQQWKLMKQNSELRIIFPGKVLTSAFPQKDDKATWVTIDAEKDETMQAALKLMESPVVITAELGGLSLDQPLNSQKLQMTMRGGADAE